MPGGFYDPKPYPVMPTDTERLSDVVKLSAHVTRILGQNPGMMTLQGTNSYLLQPPSNPLAPIMLIDTSSPHTADQYVDLLLTHLYGLGMNAGSRETHFESDYAKDSLEKYSDEKQEEYKAAMRAERADNPRANESNLNEYGVVSRWTKTATQERRLPPVEHIILTHRHLDHVGAVAALLDMLKIKGLPRPKIWKMLSPDEVELGKDDRDRHTTDAAFVNGLPRDSYIPFQPLQPLHPLMPGLMLSLIDPEYKYLIEKNKVKWNDVPEICRVSVRCLKTPGHTADSVALVMCEGERGVFTADTVLGQGTTIFTDLSAYMLSLKTLLALKPGVLYPAHGPHIPGQEAAQAHIQNYITHRQDRENQIINVLQTASSDPNYITTTLQELITKFEKDELDHENYKEEFMTQVPARDGGLTPAQKKAKDEAKDKAMKGLEVDGGVSVVGLDNIARMIYRTKDEKIVFAAKKSLTAHLEKLIREGKVQKGRGWNPVILDGKVEEAKEMDGYELVEARLTLHETEGFNRLDIRVKKGLEVTRAAIEFGVLAHLCASKYGDGAPITCNNETKALAKSLFGTGGIPGWVGKPDTEDGRHSLVMQIASLKGSENLTGKPL